jgi:hypothetical protein
MTKVMFYANTNHVGLFQLNLTFMPVNYKTNA